MKRPRTDATTIRNKPDQGRPLGNTKKARISSQVHVHSSAPAVSPISRPTSHHQQPIQSALKGSRPKAQPKAQSSPRPSKTLTSLKTEKIAPPRPNPPPQPKAPAQPNAISIVIGTYEHILYGLRLSFPPAGSPPTFSPLFHFVAHPSPLTVLAVAPFPANPTLVSSTADSPLTLWSLTKRRCLGTLSCGVLATDAGGAGREPGVRTARFDMSGKILVVGDETGGMTVYRSRDWALVRKLSGSGKGRVNDLAIEPRKGRLMLSVGHDRCLRMWDLGGGKGKGKPMASVRLGAEAERVSWSLSGKKLAVITGTIATVYDTMMSPLFTFTSPRGRVHDAKFFVDERSEEYLILACDDAVGRIFHLGNCSLSMDTEPRCVAELVGHSNRLKAVEIVSLDDKQGCTYATTISSDGFCHVYRLESERWTCETIALEVQPIAKYDTAGCRLTCLTAVAVSENHAKESGEAEESASDGQEGSASDGQEGSGSDGEENSDNGEESGEDLDANGQPLDLGDDETNSDQSD